MRDCLSGAEDLNDREVNDREAEDLNDREAEDLDDREAEEAEACGNGTDSAFAKATACCCCLLLRCPSLPRLYLANTPSHGCFPLQAWRGAVSASGSRPGRRTLLAGDSGRLGSTGRATADMFSNST